MAVSEDKAAVLVSGLEIMIHLYVKASPLASLLAEPSKVVVVPATTFW